MAGAFSARAAFAAEVEADPIPELLGEIERLRAIPLPSLRARTTAPGA